jgi:two-component system chemotaxis response regulator CheY
MLGAPVVSCSVLLIEDDASVVEAVSEALGDEGHDVAVAGDGRAALERLASAPAPDIILLDLFLPEADGHEFRRRQLAEPRLASIPTFIFSAAAPPRWSPSPASGWLRKPVELSAPRADRAALPQGRAAARAPRALPPGRRSLRGQRRHLPRRRRRP